MNSPSFLQDSTRDLTALAAEAALLASTQPTRASASEPLDEAWFDAPPPSTRTSRPPVVRVGEFLGDPEVDGWLR